MFRPPTPRPVIDKNEKRPYYELFEEYCSWVIWDGAARCFTLRFLPTKSRNGIWYVFKKGVYIETTQPEIDKIYHFAMDLFGLKTGTSQLNYCMTLLKTWTIMSRKEWMDHDPKWENNLNGYYNYKEKKHYDHTPDKMFKRQSPRHYLGQGILIPDILVRLLKIFSNEGHRENFIKYLIAVVHKKLVWGKFLLLYGKTGSGKSTILQIFPLLYGEDNSSATTLYRLGKPFGLDHMYDKRVNMHPDLPMVPINPFVIATVKTLTGSDGRLPVEIKGQTSFMHMITCFIAFGIQELIGFTQEAEREMDSWFKRVVLGYCPVIQPEDEQFKESIADPKFLDELYTWALNQTPQRFYEPGQEKEWIRRNKKEWLLKSNPILKILQENYKFCETDMIERDGIPEPNVQSILCFEIESLVRKELDAEGHIVPSQLRNQITRAFNTMFIGRSKGKGTRASWENVVRRDAE